jgi:uncharacterized protein (DUF305 family)
MRVHAVFLLLMLPAAPSPAQEASPHGQMSGFHGAMEAMQHGMAGIPATGDPDVDFARMMIPHHQGAIEMARTQLAEGKDPELRRLAEEIIAAQEQEIAFLEQWLAAKGMMP